MDEDFWSELSTIEDIENEPEDNPKSGDIRPLDFLPISGFEDSEEEGSSPKKKQRPQKSLEQKIDYFLDGVKKKTETRKSRRRRNFRN